MVSIRFAMRFLYNKETVCHGGAGSCLQVICKGGNAAQKRSAEQTVQQGNQSDADQGNAAARDQLLHALALCLCVIKKQ